MARKRKPIEPRRCSECAEDWGINGPIPYGTLVERSKDGTWTFVCLKCRQLPITEDL